MKNIVGLSAAIFGVAAAAVAGGSFISSRTSYNKYLMSYEAQQAKLKGEVPALPESVFIDNDYVEYDAGEISNSKSAYDNYYVYDAKMASIAPLNEAKAGEYKKIDSSVDDDPLNYYISSLDLTGGAITFKIKANKTGLADVAIELASNWRDASGKILAYENITDQIKIQFNKLEIKTVECELPALEEEASEFTTLVLKDVLLLEGNNPFTLTTSAYNPYKTDSNKILYVMPDIRNVAVMSSVEITMPEAE